MKSFSVSAALPAIFLASGTAFATEESRNLPTFDIIGRLQLDLSQDPPFGEDVPLDRRARLGVAAQFSEHWGGVIDLDFAGDDIAEQDLFLWYRPSASHRFVFGHNKVPSVMDEKTDDLFSTFLERATYAQFSPGYALGVSYEYAKNGWNAEIGVFGTGSDGDSFVLDHDGVQTGVRLGRVFTRGNGDQLHLGASAHAADISSGTIYGGGLTPEINAAPRLIQFALTDPDTASFLGFETGLALGAFSIQAEAGARRFASGSGPDVQADGGYLELTYMLTGEHRSLNPANSTFQRVTVLRPLSEGGFGAFQIGGRYSLTRIEQGPALSNELTSASLALNWYPEDRVRVMVNWVRHDTSSLDFIPAELANGDSGDTLGLRVQLDW